MLHSQPSSKDPARKSWGAILGLRYFRPTRGGEGEGNYISQENAAHGHVVYAVQAGIENGVKGGSKRHIVPEMIVVL
jgi:hypothetical protein